MPKFFNSDMADLAHQLTLSPLRLRVEQIRGVEELLSIVKPGQAYPFDFVCYHITKYRKRGASAASASIPGKALISDLIALAEHISRKANLSTEALGEPCITHQKLATQLHVSTKTVRRWRSRGLMGLRVVFADGVNRLVFLKSTVDRFVSQHKSVVARGASFRQLTPAERGRIVDRARALVSERPMKLHAVARIIAEETGRAVETVRYTLRRFDESRGADAVFSRDGESVLGERHAAIWRCHQAGETTESIARVFDCPVGEIDQILREVQIRLWKEQRLDCVHNELFDAPNADALILDVPEPVAEKHAKPRIPAGLPAYLQSLYLTPLLSREQEQDLFRRYNYLKYQASRLIASLDPETVTEAEYASVSGLIADVEAMRQRIIGANLRLVVSIAKKHVGWSSNFFEVISDGNMSLMRAVEKFDYSLGNKFSTYATWAVMKNYARSIPEQHYHCTRFVTGQEQVLDSAPDLTPETAPASDREQVRELIAEGMSELTDREREIVTGHFGLSGQGGAMTLEQLGERFGVTKERVRQIEQRALAHLREVLEPSLVDAFTD